VDTAQSDERLTALFDRHYGDVLAYCARRIGRDEADDAAAEVFAIAWRRIDDIDWDTPRPWLLGVARRVLSNRWRSLRRRSSLDKRLSGLASHYADAPEIFVVRREEDREMLAALGRLREPDQEVLRLTAWEDLTAAEVATVLDISTAAAEKRLQRALQRLGRIVRAEPEQFSSRPRAAEEGGG